jgi:hypothetical protein
MDAEGPADVRALLDTATGAPADVSSMSRDSGSTGSTLDAATGGDRPASTPDGSMPAADVAADAQSGAAGDGPRDAAGGGDVASQVDLAPDVARDMAMPGPDVATMPDVALAPWDGNRDLYSPAGGTGLLGAYYLTSGNDNNRFDRYAATFVDPALGTGVGATATGLDMLAVGTQRLGTNTNFAVRWEGEILADYTEMYTFFTRSDDGVRVWVNNVAQIDRWSNMGASNEFMSTSPIALQAGTWYPIKVEYYQALQGASVLLSFQSATESKKAVPPAKLRYRSPAAAPLDQPRIATLRPTRTTRPPRQPGGGVMPA